MNVHEVEYLQCYTAKEIELNKQLYLACTVDEPNFAKVEELLKRGADPLGPIGTAPWELGDHVYGEVLCDSQNSNSIHIPRITELFLQYGMDLDHPKVPYDEGERLHPMWQFAFVINENSIRALKMLLDKGLSADAAGKMWGHALFDMMILEDSDPYTDDFMYRGWTWLMKVIMLCASYDHVLQNDQDLRELIAVDDNGYDLHAFRNWENFYFEFDTTWCEDYPKIDGCMVMIFEKATGKKIWDFRV